MDEFNRLRPSVGNLFGVVMWLFAVMPNISEEHKARVEARKMPKASHKKFDADSFSWIAQQRDF